jgi:hypothetical protein
VKGAKVALLPGDWTDGHVFITVNVFKKPSKHDMGFALTAFIPFTVFIWFLLIYPLHLVSAHLPSSSGFCSFTLFIWFLLM